MNQKLKIDMPYDYSEIGILKEHACGIGFSVVVVRDVFANEVARIGPDRDRLYAFVDLDKGQIQIGTDDCRHGSTYPDRQPTDRVLWDLEDWLSVEMVAYEIKFPADGESVYTKGFSQVLQYLREQELKPDDIEITAIHICTADLDE